MRKRTLLVGLSLAIFGSITFSNSRTPACTCEAPTVCQAYSRAEAVFVGTLNNLEIDDRSFIRTARAHFNVEKVFKGSVGKQEAVRFKVSDCFRVELRSGEKYFVYKDPSGSQESVCNRTNLLSNSEAELKYVNSISERKPTYNVGGFLYGLSKDELRRTKIIIEAGKSRHEVEIDDNGLFDFLSREGSEVIVRISLPFEATVYMKDLDATFPASGRQIVYCVRLSPNECNYREIAISKKGG